MKVDATSGYITTPIITGGTADSMAIGGTTPAAGAFTTLSANGTTNTTSATGYQIGGSTVINVGAANAYAGVYSQALFVGTGAGTSFNLSGNDQFGTLGVGANALYSLTAQGSENTAVGCLAGYSLTTGGLNTAVGMHSLGAATTAVGVCGLGNDTFRDSFPAGYNVAVGQHSQAHGAPGVGVISIGSQVLRGASASVIFGGTVTPGDVISITLSASGSTPAGITGLPVTASHTAVGGDTLTTIAAALATSLNGAVGGPLLAMGVISQSNPDSTATVSLQWSGGTTYGWAITPTAGVTGAATETVLVQAGSTPGQSVAIGSNAMRGDGMASTFGNTVVGDTAGVYLRTGNYNSLFGIYSGENVTTGGNNTCIGALAGQSLTTGGSNTFIGMFAGNHVTIGGNNTLIGQGVGETTLTTGTGNLYIGTSSAIDASGSNELYTFRLGGNATNLMRATAINTASPALFLDWLPSSTSYANDTAAAAGGVGVGQIYRNGSAVMCRIT